MNNGTLLQSTVMSQSFTYVLKPKNTAMTLNVLALKIDECCLQNRAM